MKKLQKSLEELARSCGYTVEEYKLKLEQFRKESADLGEGLFELAELMQKLLDKQKEFNQKINHD